MIRYPPAGYPGARSIQPVRFAFGRASSLVHYCYYYVFNVYHNDLWFHSLSTQCPFFFFSFLAGYPRARPVQPVRLTLGRASPLLHYYKYYLLIITIIIIIYCSLLL